MTTDREELYNTLCSIISNHSLNELGILPAIPDEAERSTNEYYPFIFLENNLGIPLPVVHHIIAYSSSEFMKHRQQKDQKNLEDLELSSKVLFMVNPDHYSAANTRKSLVQSNIVDAQKELALVDLMFTIPKHSKSSIAWHHRKWIQNYLIKEKGQALDFDREFSLCERTATLYPRNYYAWTYRSWLLTRIPHIKRHEEYERSRQWVASHISDHSGLQHLQRCLRLSLGTLHIKVHLSWLREQLKRYPGHESLWCHLRYCAYLAAAKKVLEYKTEPAFIEDVLKICKDSDVEDENIQKQLQLALRYGLWITHLVEHYGLGDADLRAWADLAMHMYTKELEKLADQSTFYKLFQGWSCHAAKKQQATSSEYYKRLPSDGDNEA
ncbi:hypothetical protein K450DRAFT_230513 [Umbelopsis ramanniana AG]|uniref:Uncharacterized protein n=1 Tax=Umbelopsis ramanniana AG TaxID=1314678 RepID=A0AAD5ED07_UMBRA|nr:uncharacterized protein K450DRAFT_230513 [Umbelopsis ramanniana AG]KAI8581646.1 hypothetical protein K450DRAFT_230513 [Umbelopsis ramanniana AG]